MADATGNKPAAKAKDDGMKELRILMLHGYTQSGPLFRSKTRALEKLLTKALTPQRLRPVLIYPTAPIRLSARDIPGYQPPEASADADAADEDQTDAWAWFRKDEATARYRHLDDSMHFLASTIAESSSPQQPIDGVIGFSQGGAMAALLAAALEDTHQPATPEHEAWTAALRAANGGQRLRFAVVYSGFLATPAELGWLFAPRGIATPTLHFLGGLDTVVEEGRSRALVDRCEEGEEGSRRRVVVVHPGGHYVPVSKEWVGVLVGFIREWGTSKGEEAQVVVSEEAARERI